MREVRKATIVVAALLSCTAFASGANLLTAGDTASNPVEVGRVAWGRDLDAALADSARTGKPLFAFFQEVPGCSGCKKFGSEVMSHRPIVDAVQDEFTPVLIFNNRGGKDAKLLKRFNEPAWNYQVIRFLDAEGKDLIPRADRIWTRDALATRMIQALRRSGRPVPRYLEVVAHEENREQQATAAFAQSCFWSGEMRLGQLPGVISTEAGWLEGREVTLVHYRPEILPLETLVERAAAAGVSDKLYLPAADRERTPSLPAKLAVGVLDESYRPAGESDQKRQIRGSSLAKIEMSAMQRTKVNAFAPVDLEQALSWLTPTQRNQLER